MWSGLHDQDGHLAFQESHPFEPEKANDVLMGESFQKFF